MNTWVGVEDDTPKEGEHRASTDWPIQKYQWTDYMANPGDRVQYRVLPMVGPDKKTLRPDADTASEWTEEITLTYEAAPKIEVYFNRGIVAAQWVSRRLGITDHNLQTAKLLTVIKTPGDPYRNYLAGPLGKRLMELLSSAAKVKREIYAALYELDDEQLEAALERCGQHAHVLLANGSVKKTGQDQNRDARARLKDKIDLHARMISPRALGHNKFLVICDKQKKPRWVWTGSQNWTKTGLCTQANNSVLFDNPKLAAEFRTQWDRLLNARDQTPDDLRQENSEPRDPAFSGTKVRLWFTPTIGQTPVELFNRDNSEKADFELVLPAGIDEPTKFFRRELKKLPRAYAMVHSKVVLVDPFGEHPVLLTGSHNLGPKASGTNDENLLVIRDAPGVMAAYATNIMAIYNQYRWRFRRQVQSRAKRWKGLKDSATWQYGYLKPGSAALREIDFWVGE